MNIRRGRTSQIIPVRILDATSVTGAGKTGLTNASVNLTAYYHRELDTTATAISLVSTTSGVYLSGGFVESDATHLAGQYELSLPNAAIGSGDASTWVEVMVYDSSTGLGIAPSVTRIDLVAYDPQDATRLGLTALPNANAGASSGLPTRDANGNVAAALDWSHITNPTTTVDLSGTKISTLDLAAPDSTVVTEINADVDELITSVAAIPTTPVLTAHFDTIIGTPAVSVSADIAEIEAETDGIAAIPTNPLLSTSLISDSGTAQSGTVTNIRLRAGAPAVTLVGQTVFITGGTGTGQSSAITAYNTGIKDATTSWGTAPDATSVYVVLALQGASASGGSLTAAQVWAYVGASTLSEDTTLAAIYAKILASPIQFINPFIVVNHTLGPIVAGDAYTILNTRQIDMPVPGNIPINTGPTLKLPNEDGTTQTITGTAVQISSQWYARFELTSVQTSTLAISSAGQVVSYTAKAVATADNTTITVQEGPLICVAG
jgi:hypothetical protein